MSTPLSSIYDTEVALRWYTMGYWFAVGHLAAQQPVHEGGEFVPDRSEEFGTYCRQRKAQFDAWGSTHLPSIQDLWEIFNNERVPS